MALSPGQILNNRYRIVKLLGQGGFGAVYRAWDTNLERPVALKENLDASPEAERQFKREARLLVDLAHPSLPRIFDSFTLPGQGQYLVMDFVEGEDLQQMLDRSGGPLPEAQVLPWMAQVCEALSYLHSQNPPIIHRDVKPANIKVRLDGRAMLVDFGIAKVYDPHLRTTGAARAVTPGYSPPEQYGLGRTDARTDVYALGATLYALLSGQTPPDSLAVLTGDLPPILPVHQINPAVSPSVSAAVAEAMQLERGRRFQSAAAFKAALAAATRDDGRRTKVAPTVDLGRQTTVSPTGTVMAPSQPLASATPVAPTAVVAPATAKPALPSWVWLGAIGALAVMLLCVMGGSQLWNWLDGGTGTTPAPTEVTLLTQTAKLTSLPTEPLLTEKPTVTPSPSATPTQTPSSTPSGLEPFIMDAKGVMMALIPAGEFQMGSERGESDEKPVHMVYLDDYYIDVYEVTNALYAECVAAGKCDLPQNTNEYNNASYAEYPVVYVDWHQAQAYCEWRGGSLSTEAQWEKAARGRLEGMDYPWGNEAPVCQKGAPNGAKFDDDAGCNDTGTEPVGSYSANGYGLFDMAGNVWEWVWDWYSSYSSSSARNPTGPESGSSKVTRGGSWYRIDVRSLRVAYRNSYVPDDRYDDIGFRCARSP